MKHYAVLALLIIVFGGSAFGALANTATEIQEKKNVQNDKIIALQKEIAEYEASLIEIGKNKLSLQGEIARLDISRKKLSAEIAITQDKIASANLKLVQLGEQIGDKESHIITNVRAIEESLRILGHISDTTFVEHYFSAKELTRVWEDIDRLQNLQKTIRVKTTELTVAKRGLTTDRDHVARQKALLATLQQQLKGQKSVLDSNRKETANLLQTTKNKESNYQKILVEKQAARVQFEQELSKYESQLKYTLDPTSIPAVGRGILSFPFEQQFMSRCKGRQSLLRNVYCITQYFGNTAFARSGAYNGKGHNGVDFGAPEGTRVLAVLSGTVTATGNTDTIRGCYSYGKWVLVKHQNGLSTVYGHLSHISVTEGTQVSTGEVLGYSGKTGYATGPHLHLTLFASSGVRIVRIGDVKAKSNCSGALVPAAPTSAYLDPFEYL